MVRLSNRVLLSFIAVVLAFPMLAVAGNAVQTEQDRVVSENPANGTPDVLNGRVNAIVQVGANTMVAGGSFTQVQSPGGPVLNRSNIFAFNATTGAIDPTFAPTLNNQVTALQASADGGSVYVGGFFTQVDGATVRRVARLSLSDGQRVPGFNAGNINSRVKDLRLSQGRLYVAGQFRTVQGVTRPALVALDAATGSIDSYLNVAFAEPRNGGALQVIKIDISPDGRRLVAIGNFNTVGGASRPQIAVLNLPPIGAASRATWHTSYFQPSCASVFDTQLRDVDISPDGAYFVVTTTGGPRGDQAPCDVTTRWDLSTDSTNLQPRWSNYTGGDTTYAVAVTGFAVYVGGHFRWVDNPDGSDDAGPGAVPRQGLAALDPDDGHALDWDPGRTRGVGVFDMLATATGLWIGSDTDRIGSPRETHKKLAFMPLV